MLTWIEEEKLAALGRRLPEGVRLVLRPTSDPRSRELANFCRRLVALAPRIVLATEEEPDPAALPAIVLPNGVAWCGVPHGTELEPFGDALAGRVGAPPAGLSDVGLPAALEVFVAAHCPHCPAVVRGLMPLAAPGGRLRIAIIDGGLFADAAERAGVRAAPTVILDGRFRWTGELPMAELMRLLVERDPLHLGPVSLEMMLREGGAARLAQAMAERGALVPALLDLLCHERWPVRLGAMVAVEELYARDPALGGQALARLWERYDAAPAGLQGDILFLVGEVGAREFLERVEEAARRAGSAELREAALEAAARLRGEKGAGEREAEGRP